MESEGGDSGARVEMVAVLRWARVQWQCQRQRWQRVLLISCQERNDLRQLENKFD